MSTRRPAGNRPEDFVPEHSHSPKEMASVIRACFPILLAAEAVTLFPFVTAPAPFTDLAEMQVTVAPPQIPGMARWQALLIFSGEFSHAEVTSFGGAVRFTLNGAAQPRTIRTNTAPTLAPFSLFSIGTQFAYPLGQNATDDVRIQFTTIALAGSITAVGIQRSLYGFLSPLG